MPTFNKSFIVSDKETIDRFKHDLENADVINVKIVVFDKENSLQLLDSFLRGSKTDG